MPISFHRKTVSSFGGSTFFKLIACDTWKNLRYLKRLEIDEENLFIIGFIGLSFQLDQDARLCQFRARLAMRRDTGDIASW